MKQRVTRRLQLMLMTETSTVIRNLLFCYNPSFTQQIVHNVKRIAMTVLIYLFATLIPDKPCRHGTPKDMLAFESQHSKSMKKKSENRPNVS